MVDLVGELGVEVAERIVGQAGEMDDGVEADEVGVLDVADVLADRRDVIRRAEPVAEGAPLVKVAVEAGHVMAALAEQRYEDRPM